MEYWGQITGDAQWRPIVDETTWRAVVAVLDDPARRTTPGPARKHLLTFPARCGLCGAPVVAVDHPHFVGADGAAGRLAVGHLVR